MNYDFHRFLEVFSSKMTCFMGVFQVFTASFGGFLTRFRAFCPSTYQAVTDQHGCQVLCQGTSLLHRMGRQSIGAPSGEEVLRTVSSGSIYGMFSITQKTLAMKVLLADPRCLASTMLFLHAWFSLKVLLLDSIWKPLALLFAMFVSKTFLSE